MNQDEILANDINHLWHHVVQMRDVELDGSKVIVKGEGAFVWDIAGREIIDGMSGIYTTQIGHGRKEIRDAINHQAEIIEFYPIFQYYSNLPSIELAAKLANMMPGDLKKIFFVNSGSEAVDSALKLARGYWYYQSRPGKTKFICLRGGFHGTTFGSVTATGVSFYKPAYEPLVPGFHHVPAPFCYRCFYEKEYPSCNMLCVRAIEELIKFEGPQTVAAFISEPIMNPIGEVVPPKEYFPIIRELCDKYEILMITDEVITGFGRTGTMFASEWMGVTPDMITLAKGITSGYLPLGAVAVSDRIATEFYGESSKGFFHGSTFGGHPLCCAAALANIKILEQENLVRKAKDDGEFFFNRLNQLYQHRIIGDIRGKGLLIGIDIVKDKETHEKFDLSLKVGVRIRERAYELGLICRDQRDVLIMAIPFIMTREQLEKIATILEQAITEIESTV
jgi:putrescine---pyruvate transaminase